LSKFLSAAFFMCLPAEKEEIQAIHDATKYSISWK